MGAELPLWPEMCFLATAASVWVGVGVGLDGDEAIRSAAPSDKGILSLFMPPLRHFNLEMLDISIAVLSLRGRRQI